MAFTMFLHKIILFIVLEVYVVYCFPTSKESIKEQSYTFYNRTEWGALPGKYLHPLSTPVPYVVIHHTYSPAACTTHEGCVAAMQSMQAYHMSLDWGDIGYNFCLGNSGDVYEGRGWEVKGIHAGRANSISVGICLIGDWRVDIPPQEMLEATKAVIETGVESGYISPDYKLVGHRQIMATECPGVALFNIISKWDHFSDTFST